MTTHQPMINLFIRASFLLAMGLGSFNSFSQETTAIQGTVIDQEDERPIPYTNIYIKNTFLGTVANSDGTFLIKIPEHHNEDTLVISSIGFKVLETKISDLTVSDTEHTFRLQNSAYLLNPVQVPNADLILREALLKIPQNYTSEYLILTSFYREVVKKNNDYVDLSQGVLNIAKVPYVYENKKFNNDRDLIGVQKGHRINNYKGRDTLAFKVMGGPNTMMLLDMVKNPGSVLSKEYINNYEYFFDGIVNINGRRTYVLEFHEIQPADVWLFEGKIYIDEKSSAIAGVTFSMPESLLSTAGAALIQQKPSLAILTPLKLAYEVRYREQKGKWYLDYVRNEIEMKVNWKRRLFNSKFNATTELVVTNKHPTLKHELPEYSQKISKRQKLFSDQIQSLEDTQYWEDFSIIRPEEDLKKAISKISRN